MSDKNKRLTIELNENLFYQLKEFCVKNKITIKQYLTQLIINELEKK